MKKQGGQDFVEFALVLPLFVLFLMGIVYGGLLYGDFVSYNNWVRSAAREAAIENPTDYSANGYSSLEQYYYDQIINSEMNTHLYTLKSRSDFSIVSENNAETITSTDFDKQPRVIVTLKLSLNDNGNGLVETLKSWPDSINLVKKDGQLRTFTLQYTMYDEIHKISD